MYETIRHIEYLLMYHDCVCVPGVGAFVSQYVPAAFDDESGTVLPPRRVCSFNPEIQHDDGLLCASVSRRGALSYEEARQQIDHDVNEIRSVLKTVGEIRIGNVGVLRRQRKGTMEFIPTVSGCVSPALSSLAPVCVSTPGVDETLRIVRRRGMDSVMFRVASVAASLVLLVMLAIGLVSPLISDGTVKASLQPVIQFFKPDMPPTVVDVDFNPAVDLAIAMPDSLTSISDLTAPFCPGDMRYVIVIASLVNRQEAETFIRDNQHDDVVMSILDSDSRCRVVVDGGHDLHALTDDLMSWREIFPNAWIYRQK